MNMGYRSEVAIAMKKSDYEELEARVKMTNKEEVINLLEARDKFIDKGDVIIIGWDWVKWYAEYEDVLYIQDYLCELNEQGHPYSFVRVGESYDDIDEWQSFGEDGNDYSCDIIHFFRGIDID